MKILFTDLDGTLLTDDKTILDRDKDAIKSILALGHKFVICSGRPLASVKILAQKYGFLNSDFLIVSFNGGQIYDCKNKKVILNRSIPISLAKKIMDEAHLCGFHAHTYAKDFVVSEYETEALKDYCQNMKMDYVVTKNVIEYFEKNCYESTKVNVITPFDRDSLEVFRTNLLKITKNKLFDVFSKPQMLEYSNLKSNKGDALSFVASYYGIDLKETIAIGDEENDIPMIQTAGIGIAMRNATDFVKKSANYVTLLNNNEGAISEIIEKFF